MFHKDLENATGLVLVAVSTGKVTMPIEELAHEIISYHDHSKFAYEAGKAIECLVARVERDAKADSSAKTIKRHIIPKPKG